LSLSTSILNNFKSEWINDALTAEMALFIGILRLYLSGIGGVPLGTKREADFLCSIAGDLFKRCFERAGFGQMVSGMCTGRISRSKLFSHYGFSVISDKC
jgi:hypothetical protein